MGEPIPIHKARYPRIIQITTSMNSSCGDEYIYGLDSEGNLWVVGFAGVGTAQIGRAHV